MKNQQIILLLAWLIVAPAAAQQGPLETVVAEKRGVPETRWFDGQVQAVNQATVAAQTSGRVVGIEFDVNEYVQRGDVIVRLKDTEEKARQQAAAASLRSARAQLTEAQQEYNRIKAIYEKKLVAKAQLDKAEAALKSARAAVNAAEAKQQEAEEQLEHTVIRAPYSGLVVERHVELGETAQPGQPLMTGLSLEKLRVEARLPQSVLTKVQQGAEAVVKLPEDQLVQLAGLTVFPLADAGSHSFRVRANLPPGQHDVFPGMWVKLGIISGQRETLMIPKSALAYRSEVSAVYVVDENDIQMRQVLPGRESDDGEWVEVLAGLDAGERVAVDPVKAAIVLKRNQAQ